MTPFDTHNGICGDEVLEFDWFVTVTPDARLLSLVLEWHRQRQVFVVTSAEILRETGLPFERVRQAAHQLKDLQVVEKYPEGVGFSESMLVSLGTLRPGDAAALASTPVRRVKDEEDLPPGFARLYRIYPNPAGKMAALKVYKALAPDDQMLAEMMEGTLVHIRGWQLAGRPIDKIPHLKTFLNQRQWKDAVRVGPMGGMSSQSATTAAAAEEALRRRRMHG